MGERSTETTTSGYLSPLRRSRVCCFRHESTLLHTESTCAVPSASVIILPWLCSFSASFPPSNTPGRLRLSTHCRTPPSYLPADGTRTVDTDNGRLFLYPHPSLIWWILLGSIDLEAWRLLLDLGLESDVDRHPRCSPATLGGPPLSRLTQSRRWLLNIETSDRLIEMWAGC